jgi:hypothetical protein
MAGFQFSNAIMRCPFSFSFLYSPHTRSAVTVQNKEKGDGSGQVRSRDRRGGKREETGEGMIGGEER